VKELLSGSQSEPQRTGHRPARARRIRQRGLTLIEILVALAVLAIGVVGIAAGFASIVHDSAISQQQASLDAGAASVVNYIQTSDPYTVCARSYILPTPLPPGVWSAAISNISLTPSSFTRTGSDNGTGPLPSSRCHSDYGTQKITLRVCGPSSPCITETFWKGDT
jgi:prepilin-type N-terminal cleavage/methylation domain-containing protein